MSLSGGRGVVYPELVINGDASAGTSPWFGIGGGTIAVVSGEFEVTGGGAFSGIRQTMSGLIVSATYRARVTARRGTTADQVGLLFGATQVLTSATVNTPLELTFVATATSHNLQGYINSGTAAGTAYFDNFSLRRIA
jgi:hypothetical protein